ncbi:outer membrane beta-barrel protein [Telluribacter sp. SYSU D00476]|uniref:outer membrane beta-barrel protein n=1 Tax=Telluribacter sp. SYSU D00476 TaxID=2811430 RepID=UPI001FF571F5|nr:outer membrane beta-barrel protein [Telluribacter sp. SYSU D00476]
MKFKIVTIALLTVGMTLLLSFGSYAQSKGPRFTLGLKVGANYSQIDDLSYRTPRLGQDGLPIMSGGNIVYDFFQQNDSHSTGIVGGVYARIGRTLYLQPEVLLSVKGGKMNLIRDGLQTQSFNAKVGTIDLPLLLGLRLGSFRINAGPMASLTVMDGNLKEAVKKYSNQSIAQTSQQAQFSYQAGIGFTFQGVQLDLRREASLSNQRWASSSIDPLAVRSSLWQLTAGFGF